ncbi:hypothetical protein KKB55_22715 [Myxococcota bacterium]|nr:hypothetical protein [Myxococcota bacterium]MBU1900568.1 hypothetical protein [Myxococcota bacterium]
MKRALYLSPWLVFALACSDDPAPSGEADIEIIDPVRDQGINPPPPTGCISDLTCAAGQVCVNQACRAGQCNRERTCPGGQTCDTTTYTCTGSEQTTCTNHNECAGQGYCVDGTCQAVQCVDDAHCAPNEECNDQRRCVAQIARCADGDGDGYGQGCQQGADCDDGDANIHPGATELCGDGIDQDCSGRDLDCGANDNDGDGVTDAEGDCDDNNPNVSPRQAEVPYNGLDDDCNVQTSDDDLDRDGYLAVEAGGDDCDDRASHINPEGRDIPGNGIDEDCDGADRQPDNEDRDGDGVTEADGDCNDENRNVNPGATEVPYNSVDDDCNPETLDNDLDGDGFNHPQDCDDQRAAVNPTQAEVYYNNIDDDCDPQTLDDDQDGDGFNHDVDCNDESAAIHPEGAEVRYNGVDDDCDPSTPDDDLDGDGHGHDADCNDEDPSVHPGVVEDANTLCGDGVDHDCDGRDPECGVVVTDSDDDGWPDEEDCAPQDPQVHPGMTEIRGNGVDDDCNPATPDEIGPCADDAFDETASNNTLETATAVADGNTIGVQYGQLSLCADPSGAHDWYKVDLAIGDGLEIDVMFNTDEGDIDLELFKVVNGGEPVYVDGSPGIVGLETVYERRATSAATYYVHVFDYERGDIDYRMTVNVFQGCVDDLAGPQGEHKDSRDYRDFLERPLSDDFPPPAEARQICDYDNDWYSFTLEQAADVRLDLVFLHAEGDLDLELYSEAGDALQRATSTNDDELIERRLDPGFYQARVYGVGAAKGRYHLLRSRGTPQTARQVLEDDYDIPDFDGINPGVVEVELFFDLPANAIIRDLEIRDLDINHDFIPDLKVTALWNEAPVVVLWDRQGDQDGNDGGFDDDSFPFTGGDINFDNRHYREFAGLPAEGYLTLRVEDYVGNDVGEIVDLDVEIKYLIP